MVLVNVELRAAAAPSSDVWNGWREIQMTGPMREVETAFEER